MNDNAAHSEEQIGKHLQHADCNGKETTDASSGVLRKHVFTIFAIRKTKIALTSPFLYLGP